jgi:hypothetical protein
VKKETRKKLRYVAGILGFLATLLSAWRVSWEWAVGVFIFLIIVFIGLYIITVRREMKAIDEPPHHIT